MDSPQISTLVSTIAAFIVALGIAIPVVFKYWRDVRATGPIVGRRQLDLLGAALGDSQALDRLRDELRELRMIATMAATHAERTNELISDINESIKDVAQAVRRRRT